MLRKSTSNSHQRPRKVYNSEFCFSMARGKFGHIEPICAHIFVMKRCRVIWNSYPPSTNIILMFCVTLMKWGLGDFIDLNS